MELYTIYLICAVVGGVILITRIVLIFLGIDQGEAAGGVDSALDLNVDGIPGIPDTHPGVAFLSMQSIAGFFTMFGLVGMGLLKINAPDILSLVGGLAAGVFTAWATGMIFWNMRRLQSEGTLVINNAIGQTGTVYLTIPEQGAGVVNVTIQGAMRTLDAVSKNGRRIPTGSIVQVVAITAGKILVVSEPDTEKS